MIERSNPFSPIYQSCNSGNSKEKLVTLPDFPRLIDIELTNTCNFRCLMCPTGNMTQIRKKGFMKDSVFNKILDEIKDRLTPLRFIRWGEPTMHPKFLDYIHKAKQLNILCHINTNGSFLNEENITEVIDTGLDSIKFSFQGVDRKSYKEMRNIDYFEDLIEVVSSFYKIRGKREKPYIHVSTTITYEDKNSVLKFKDTFSKITDLTTVGRTNLEHVDPEKTRLSKDNIETLRRLKEKETLVKKYLECPEVFDKLSINWDGTVSACCEDYDNKMLVGDINKDKLEVIWKSEKMNSYRVTLSNMGHDSLELCRTCYDYAELQTPGLQNIVKLPKI